MNLSLSCHEGLQIARFAGPLDQSAARLFQARLDGLLGDGTTRLIVDLRGVSHLSQAGVRALSNAARRLREAGGRMRLCGASRTAQTRLRSLLFNPRLECDRSLGEAIWRCISGASEEDPRPSPFLRRRERVTLQAGNGPEVVAGSLARVIPFAPAGRTALAEDVGLAQSLETFRTLSDQSLSLPAGQTPGKPARGERQASPGPCESAPGPSGR